MSGIIAKKLQMTQIASDDNIVPVTLLRVPKHIVSQIKTTEKDGYNAVVVDVMSDDGEKVAFKKELDFSVDDLDAIKQATAEPENNEASEAEEVSEVSKDEDKQEAKEAEVNKDEKPQDKKEDVAQDEDVEEEEEVSSKNTTQADPYIGMEIPVAILSEIGEVQMTSVSKGKGFTGAMKRWNFKGGPAAHGSKFHRALGSIGTRKPRRTKPGRKMHGRHGTFTKTLKSVPVELVDVERRIVAVRGPVPGGRNTYVHLQFS